MRGRLVVGILLVAIGIGAMLDIADVWDFGGWMSTWWPLLLVAVALLQMGKGHWVGPSILLLLGVFFLARNLGYIEQGWGRFLWPAVIVVIGVGLIAGALRGTRPQPASSKGSFDRLAMFGGVEERVVGRFERGSMLVAFGGAEIDLREAELSPGALIDATAAFGGIDVLVAPGTRVRVEGMPIFGGVDNKVTPSAEGAELTVKATAVFGGVSVKDKKG